MSKTLLIIQREFITRVKKKSFILMTVLMPFIFAALVFVPMWLASIEDDEQKTVAVYDQTREYLPLFKDNANYSFEPVTDPQAPALYADTTKFEAVIAITGDLIKNPKAVTIYSNKEVSAGLLSFAENLLNEHIRKEKLRNSGIKGLETIINDIQSEITIPTVKRDAEGQTTSSNTHVAIASGFILTILIYMFVMTYGGMVMSSVMEEKTNRIVELMVSSVKPFQLMMGKIVGISLVGFVQLAIWCIMLFVILTGAGIVFGLNVNEAQQAAMAVNMGGMGATPDMAILAQNTEATEMYAAITNLPYLEMAIMFLLYFTGGYLLYASFFAAVGASVNEQEDSSQFMMPVVFIMIFGLYAAMGSSENTNGPLAFWASMFPLTSPIVMMVRIPFSVPLWQEILSIVLLYATALFFIWASARIYRVGILMYGKKPTVKDMIKWLRFK